MDLDWKMLPEDVKSLRLPWHVSGDLHVLDADSNTVVRCNRVTETTAIVHAINRWQQFQESPGALDLLAALTEVQQANETLTAERNELRARFDYAVRAALGHTFRANPSAPSTCGTCGFERRFHTDDQET